MGAGFFTAPKTYKPGTFQQLEFRFDQIVQCMIWIWYHQAQPFHQFGGIFTFFTLLENRFPGKYSRVDSLKIISLNHQSGQD